MHSPAVLLWRGSAAMADEITGAAIERSLERIRWVMRNMPLEFKMRDECPIDMLMSTFGVLDTLKWREMDAAPKDGTQILCASLAGDASDGYFFDVVQWDVDCWMTSDSPVNWPVLWCPIIAPTTAPQAHKKELTLRVAEARRGALAKENGEKRE